MMISGRNILLLGAMLIAAAPAALAQTVPGATPPSTSELIMPSSAQPAPVAATTVTTTTTTASSEVISTAPQGVRAARDPCPTPKAANESDPDDLAKVQEDIDRFTLCVQRAQLLERLNESAAKSVQSTDSALGLGGMGGMGGTLPFPSGPTGMAPLPADALGGVDVSPKAPAAATTTTTTTTTSSSASSDKDDAKEEEDTAKWTIREIYGSTTNMQARLVSPEGDEVKVQKGSKLSDGGLVTSINPTGVSVRGAGGVKSLEWAGS